jgi:hypothetical protein
VGTGRAIHGINVVPLVERDLELVLPGSESAVLVRIMNKMSIDTFAIEI